MKIRLLTGVVYGNLAFGPGDVIDMPAAEARKMIKAGNAVLARSMPVSEKAVPPNVDVEYADDQP